MLPITPPLVIALLTGFACSEPTQLPPSPLVQADVAAAERNYTITDLGTLGGSFAEAQAINDEAELPN